MPIEQLTNQMKQLKESGPADLKLTTETRDAYIKAINEFRTVLQTEHDKIPDLANIGNVGGYASANQTKTELTLNVNSPTGIMATLKKYIAYLDEFEATLNAACSRMLNEG